MHTKSSAEGRGSGFLAFCESIRSLQYHEGSRFAYSKQLGGLPHTVEVSKQALSTHTVTHADFLSYQTFCLETLDADRGSHDPTM